MSYLEELIKGKHVCTQNGRHTYVGDKCSVCATIQGGVRVYGYYQNEYSRLLARCSSGHVFYTSCYMAANVDRCNGVGKVTNRHKSGNHIFCDEGANVWQSQDCIKIKRMLQLILYYIARCSASRKNMNGVRSHYILWQDDACDAGNVIACSHVLKYVVTYVNDPHYVDVAAWCKEHGYHLIVISHFVGRGKNEKGTKVTNTMTMRVLAKGLLDAGCLASYRHNTEEFLECFVEARHKEFTQLGSIIIRPNTCVI